VASSLEILAQTFSIAKLSEAQRLAFERVPRDAVEVLVRYAYNECKSSPRGATALIELAERAEASDVPLAQLLSQIALVYRWLDARQLKSTLGEITEYVACACEGSGLQAGHSIEWYLEQYGFARAVPI